MKKTAKATKTPVAPPPAPPLTLQQVQEWAKANNYTLTPPKKAVFREVASFRLSEERSEQDQLYAFEPKPPEEPKAILGSLIVQAGTLQAAGLTPSVQLRIKDRQAWTANEHRLVLGFWEDAG